jgi:hypothetical protein
MQGCMRSACGTGRRATDGLGCEAPGQQGSKSHLRCAGAVGSHYDCTLGEATPPRSHSTCSRPARMHQTPNPIAGAASPPSATAIGGVATVAVAATTLRRARRPSVVHHQRPRTAAGVLQDQIAVAQEEAERVERFEAAVREHLRHRSQCCPPLGALAAAGTAAPSGLDAAAATETAVDADRGVAWAAAVHEVVSGEGPSITAHAVRVASSVVIGCASLMIVLASVQCGDDICEELPLWAPAEVFCVIFFTAEYLVKICTAPAAARQTSLSAHTRAHSAAYSVAAFALRPMNLVDLFSVLPWYIEQLLTCDDGEEDCNWSAVLRLLRIARVLRVLKLGRVSSALNVFTRGLSRSRDYLLTLMMLLCIITTMFGSLLFHAEGSAAGRRRMLQGGGVDEHDHGWPRNPAPSPAEKSDSSRADALPCDSETEAFVSVPDTFWFVMSELTTVGNSRKQPLTVMGKVLAMVVMAFGVIFLGFGQAIIVTNFEKELQEHAREFKGDQGAKQWR